MRKTMQIAALLGASSVLLASCGGGGGEVLSPAPAPAPAPAGPTLVSGTDVPVAATQDAAAAFDFVAGVAATQGDRAEPLVLGDASLATSETVEARAVQ